MTLTDDAFPIALQSVSAGIFQGSTPIDVGIPAGTPTTVTLAADTNYGLLVAAVIGVPAGLLIGLNDVADRTTRPVVADSSYVRREAH